MLFRSPSVLKVTISDDGAPYDPLAEIDIPAPDGIGESPSDDQSATEGLSFIDEATYERSDGSNIVSFSKGW